MIDTRDSLTMDAFPQPRRGRKPTGKALSPAERKRAQRERDKAAASRAAFPADYAEISTSGLIEALSDAVRDKSPAVVKKLSAELLKRSKA